MSPSVLRKKRGEELRPDQTESTNKRDLLKF